MSEYTDAQMLAAGKKALEAKDRQIAYDKVYNLGKRIELATLREHYVQAGGSLAQLVKDSKAEAIKQLGE